MSFTPGPWEDPEPTLDGKNLYIGYHGNWDIALIELAYAPTKEQAVANAQLISAAPDLFEALKVLELQALQSDVNSPANEWGRDALTQARAALSKAEGHIGQELAPDPERRVNGAQSVSKGGGQ